MRKIYLGTTLAILVFAGACILSCNQSPKANEFNIYVSEDNPGWHFVEIIYDTINKGYHRINVKFDFGQEFQTAKLRNDLKDYNPTFLFETNDTARTGLWFKGEYTYDSLQKKFICFYMPNERQRKTIKDYLEDPSYDSLRYEMDLHIENYLREKGELK